MTPELQAGGHALLQAELGRALVCREHDLLAVAREVVEGVEEEVDGLRRAAEPLDVVDDEDVDVMVVLLERPLDVPGRVDHGIRVVAHELAGVAIDADAVGVIDGEVVLDGLEQVGLAHARPAVDEQRVIAVASVGHGLCGLEGQLVLLALDEGVKRQLRVCRGDVLARVGSCGAWQGRPARPPAPSQPRPWG